MGSTSIANHVWRPITFGGHSCSAAGGESCLAGGGQSCSATGGGSGRATGGWRSASVGGRRRFVDGGLVVIAISLATSDVQEGLASGQFPMVGLETKKAVILNEWAFEHGLLPMGVQLLWFEGKAVPITRPQITDAYYGHCKYKGSAPIFATSPLHLEPLMQRAAEAVAAGLPSDLTMLMRRLRVYKFTVQTQAPADQLPPCGKCFASFVLEGEAAYCVRRQ